MTARVAFLGLALALVACAPVPLDEPEVSAGALLLPDTDWRLVEISGTPFTAPLVVTLTADGRVVGQGPCNRFTAPYAGRWPDLTFQPVASTRSACPELAQEIAALDTLGQVSRGAIGADGLTLSAPDGGYLRLERVR